jgi:hypothetical protein
MTTYSNYFKSPTISRGAFLGNQSFEMGEQIFLN